MSNQQLISRRGLDISYGKAELLFTVLAKSRRCIGMFPALLLLEPLTTHRSVSSAHVQQFHLLIFVRLVLAPSVLGLRPVDHIYALVYLDCMQIGVHTYMRLLASGGESTSSFYFQELVEDSDAVVPVLVGSRSNLPEQQAKCVLGLELLAHFISEQNTADYAKPFSRHIRAWRVPLSFEIGAMHSARVCANISGRKTLVKIAMYFV
jgi:hypothetical protein